MPVAYFKAFNAIFCKVGRYASEEVVLNLLRIKCLPALYILYRVEACPLLVRDRKSFEFTITRSFMKLFRTGSVTVVTDCQKFSYFLPVTSLYQIDIRTVKFLQKFPSSDNHICNLFSKKAEIVLVHLWMASTCITTTLKKSKEEC